MLPLNTITVSAAITPAVVGTWFSHYLNRKPLHQKPTAHISYDLGLHLVRRFVEFSAEHTIEELQAFTSQGVPAPHWVKADEIEIPKITVDAAAEHLQAQLGPEGIEQVGGKQWWQWRRDDGPLKAEWIEMRKDYNNRKAQREKGRRVMLYVHGGAYYFGSVDEHRYQIQRHARKLKARCLAPRYRLAPQFPFPCGLHDCLSAYLHLLSEHESTSIVLAGDSAGGGMVLSLLTILRDQGIPLPAGGILLSPWVDLMHSFPSLSGDGKMDYIPSNGFIHQPSMGWPPPTLEAIDEDTMPSGLAAAQPTVNEEVKSTSAASDAIALQETKDSRKGFSITPFTDVNQEGTTKHAKESKMRYRDNMTGRIEGSTHIPSVLIDGNLVQIRDQIQMYAPNHLLTHPLVSPALQPSLGGLPPLLIQVGGGEMLRDEQIYVGHKAANPGKYPPSKEILDRYDPDRTQLNEYKPTDVQLQVWEDICHVGHTLSWTRPAKYMYRSVAQFGAWALARAQRRPIDIGYDSSDSESDNVSDPGADDDGVDDDAKAQSTSEGNTPNLPHPSFSPIGPGTSIGKAGDPLPPFKNHMIRQRVDRHGHVYLLASESSLPALQMAPDEIGVLKEGPVRKWLVRHEKWNKKFASKKRELQKKRAAQLEKGYLGIPEGEKPPPTALAGRRTKDLPRLAKMKKSRGMSLWSEWGSKHDESRLERDVAAEQLDEVASQQKSNSKDTNNKHQRTRSRTQPHRSVSARRHSRRPSNREVVDEGQVGASSRPHSAAYINGERPAESEHARSSSESAWDTNFGELEKVETIIPFSESETTRPTHDGIAYPFKLKAPETNGRDKNPSVITLVGDANSVYSGTVENDESLASRAEEDWENGTLTNGATPPKYQTVAEGKKKVERPPVERFVTAAEAL